MRESRGIDPPMLVTSPVSIKDAPYALLISTGAETGRPLPTIFLLLLVNDRFFFTLKPSRSSLFSASATHACLSTIHPCLLCLCPSKSFFRVK